MTYYLQIVISSNWFGIISLKMFPWKIQLLYFNIFKPLLMPYWKPNQTGHFTNNFHIKTFHIISKYHSISKIFYITKVIYKLLPIWHSMFCKSIFNTSSQWYWFFTVFELKLGNYCLFYHGKPIIIYSSY